MATEASGGPREVKSVKERAITTEYTSTNFKDSVNTSRNSPDPDRSLVSHRNKRNDQSGQKVRFSFGLSEKKCCGSPADEYIPSRVYPDQDDPEITGNGTRFLLIYNWTIPHRPSAPRDCLSGIDQGSPVTFPTSPQQRYANDLDRIVLQLYRKSPESWRAKEEQAEFLHYIQQNTDAMYTDMYMDPDELQYYPPQDHYNNYVNYENDFESPPLRETPVKCKKESKKPLPSKSFPLTPTTPNSLRKYTVLDPIKSKKDNIVKESINEIKKNTVSVVESRNKGEQITDFNEKKREKMNLLEELPIEASEQIYLMESPPPEENREINSSPKSIKQANEEEILKKEKVIIKNIGKFSLRNDENIIDEKVNMPERKETKDENDINNKHIFPDMKKNENEISSKIFGKSLLKLIPNSESKTEDALKSNKNTVILPGENFQNNPFEREKEEKQYRSSLLEIRNELTELRDEIR
ncbi:putative leucine-rich repeat-containing protein DDB_G0290503 [Centruroides vittatus]|uniref:putative leucine-rich repeat-containing protein DDB_G0290503 n=1 Tax=Centruroides vittatus TaxID=120091 RepID=UPI0035100671